MLSWVSLAAATLALGVSLRWVVTRVDGLGRTRPFPAISVVLAALVAGGSALPVLRHARLESRLAAAARALTGVEVEVSCQTLGQTWLDAHTEPGYVSVAPDGRPEHRTVISHETCNDLSAWLGSDRRDPGLEQVVAVHVLAHEAMHMAGTMDEARAECLAVQLDARLARALGDSPERSRELARRYYTQVFPRMPDAYRSAACVPGGALDEDLPDPPWER